MPETTIEDDSTTEPEPIVAVGGMTLHIPGVSNGE